MEEWIPGTAVRVRPQREIFNDTMEIARLNGFGDRLRAWRKKRNLNQNQLSLRCNVSRTSISRYECNYYTPHYETTRRIARCLNVDDQLMNELN